MAFIDNSSDTTLVTEQFVAKHHLRKMPSELAISKVNGTQVTSAKQVALNLLSLETGQQVETTTAFTIRDLPVRAVKSIKELASR